jgi:ATP-dependent DNA helicase RecG
LALTLYGDLSISALKTPPNKDKKITTKTVPEKLREQAYQWIKNRGESTFIVCPLIEESEFEGFENIKAASAEYETLRNGIFSGLEVGLLHGRMKSKEKEEVIRKFREGEIRILVSTPVIEVGIDIPDATIIVIESAERYGLASLHQLRGRVGRGAKEGFCFAFMSNNSRLGYKRLKNLENISDGLKLAEIDMQMRGQGDIYGTMQHGFKKFKIADINNLELLEETKLWAEKVFPKLEEYPLLKKRVLEYGGNWAADN